MQKLVAVMYTDIAGYTSISEENDALASKLKMKHKNAIVELIEGRIGIRYRLCPGTIAACFPQVETAFVRCDI